MCNENGKVITALLAGVAAGAILGLLFAPDKGSETRDRLSDSLSDLGDAIKERAEEQYNQINDLKERVISSIKGEINSVESYLDDEIEEHA